VEETGRRWMMSPPDLLGWVEEAGRTEGKIEIKTATGLNGPTGTISGWECPTLVIVAGSDTLNHFWL